MSTTYVIGFRQLGDIQNGTLIRFQEGGITEWFVVREKSIAGGLVTLTVQRLLPDGRLRQITTDPFPYYDLAEVQVEIPSPPPSTGAIRARQEALTPGHRCGMAWRQGVPR